MWVWVWVWGVGCWVLGVGVGCWVWGLGVGVGFGCGVWVWGLSVGFGCGGWVWGSSLSSGLVVWVWGLGVGFRGAYSFFFFFSSLTLSFFIRVSRAMFLRSRHIARRTSNFSLRESGFLFSNSSHTFCAGEGGTAGAQMNQIVWCSVGLGRVEQGGSGQGEMLTANR